MRFKITYSEAVYVNGEKKSEVTYYAIRRGIEDYWAHLMEFEKIKDGHNNENLVNEYFITETDNTAVLTYNYAPIGLTILKGIAYERVSEDTPINDGPIYVKED